MILGAYSTLVDRGDDTSIAGVVESGYGSLRRGSGGRRRDPLVVHVDQDRADHSNDVGGVGADSDDRLRCLIFLLTRSRGLVDRILRQCARGKPAKVSTSVLASS